MKASMVRSLDEDVDHEAKEKYFSIVDRQLEDMANHLEHCH